MVVQELSLFILTKFTGNENIIVFLVQEGLLAHVFRILRDINDPDIQLNSLLLLEKLLDAPQAKYVLQEIEEFDPKILLCYNKTHPIPEVQELSLNLINKISDFKQNPLQIKFAEMKIVEEMLDIITVKEIFH